MPTIHPTAILEGDINLADDVIIGPFCFLSGAITLGAGVQLMQQVNIQGPATIGARTILYPGAAIGYEPQDYKFAPGSESAGVTIGEDCLIREHASVHSASNNETPTRIGNHVFLMVNAHVGHDAQVGNDAILVNNTALGGHSYVGEKAICSGGVMIHQFCRAGRLSMLSGGSSLTVDLPPFCTTLGRNELVGLNLVGLRRNGFAKEEIGAIREAFVHVLRKNLPKSEILSELANRGENSPGVQEMHDFIAESKKPICQVGRG
jgi:UDP-N-acetylglucosamine acyltransferase